MRIIEGVEAHAYLDGNELESEHDGFVGKLYAGRLVTLIVGVAPQRRGAVHPFVMDGSKNVSLLRERGEEERELEQYELLDQVGQGVASGQLSAEDAEELRQEIVALDTSRDEGVYRLNMVLVSDRGGAAMAKYPGNVLRLVEMFPNGRTMFHRVALASEDGRFFIAQDVAYDVRVYRNAEGAVYCPAIHLEWPQAESLLAKLWADCAEQLADISEYVREPEPSIEGLSFGQGRVLWASEGMGQYAILTAEGTARAYRRDLVPRADSRLRRLYPGEIVEFDRLEAPRRKREISRFGYREFSSQAYGVRLVG